MSVFRQRRRIVGSLKNSFRSNLVGLRQLDLMFPWDWSRLSLFGGLGPISLFFIRSILIRDVRLCFYLRLHKRDQTGFRPLRLEVTYDVAWNLENVFVLILSDCECVYV